MARSTTSRIALLEAELAQVNKERAADADDLATMLVRIADAERGKAAATQRAQEMEGRAAALELELRAQKVTVPPAQPDPRVRELTGELDAVRLRLGEAMGIEARLRGEAHEVGQRLTESQAMTATLRAQVADGEARVQAVLVEVRQAEEAVQLATSRAVLAERSAADGATAFERLHAELESDRARVVDLEAKLARVSREHNEGMEAARREQAEAVEGAARGRAAEVAGLEARHTEALRAREQEHREATTAMRDENARTVAALREEHAGAIGQRHREHVARVEALTASHGAELQALAKTHQDALKALEERHAHTLTAVREEHAASKRSANRALEEERSAAARARQQVLALETSVASLRATAARVTLLLDDLARREGEATAARVQEIQQAKLALAVDASPAATDAAARARAAPKGAPEPVASAGSLDEVEIDFGD
jgi:chromosome segregation ATPase